VTTPPPAAGPADRLEAGTILSDRYEVLRRLGTGAMGAVYLARHRHMERLCAIKVLHAKLSDDREALERFTREARNASRIGHPNVCTVYDFGRTPDGLVYLAMEYVEGRTLGSILAERGSLSPRRAASLAGQIAAGLDAAHAMGIVHRDLKPDNVMVAGGRDGEIVKLVDFGIAKALERDLGRDVTAPGVVVGTPDYMAPEQFAGDPTDHRSDLYALALIFFRMVTGTLPFGGTSARETLTRRLTDPPRALRQAAPQVAFPDELQAVLDRALARRPDQRYPTGAALIEALQAALVSLPPETADATETVRLDAPTAALREATLPTRRRRGLPYLIAAAAAAVLVTAVMIRRSAGGTPDTTQRAETKITMPPPAAPVLDSGPAASRTPTRPSGRATIPSGGPVSQLPTPDEVLAPETQSASRARAEQIYGRTGAEPAMRAQAAFIVATIAGQQSRYADAETWAIRAAAANDSAVAGVERDRRAERYRSFLTQVQLKRKEPTPP
jgi:serine/threonine-protein kinase